MKAEDFLAADNRSSTEECLNVIASCVDILRKDGFDKHAEYIMRMMKRSEVFKIAVFYLIATAQASLAISIDVAATLRKRKGKSNGGETY